MRKAIIILAFVGAAAHAGWWLGPAASWAATVAAKGYDGDRYEEKAQHGSRWGGAGGFGRSGLSATASLLYVPGYDSALLIHVGTTGETYWTEEGTAGFDARLRGRWAFGEGWFAPTAGGTVEWGRRRGEATQRYFWWMDRGDEPVTAASWAANDFYAAPIFGGAGAFGRISWEAGVAFGWRHRGDAGATVQRRYYETGYVDKEVVPYRAIANAGTLGVDATVGVRVAAGFRVDAWARGRADLFASDNVYGKPDERKDLLLGITPAYSF